MNPLRPACARHDPRAGRRAAADQRAQAKRRLSALGLPERGAAEGRQGRIAEASPLVPPLVWLILIVGAVIVIASVCLFADADEARIPQVAMIAGVAGLVVSGLLLVRFLDKPYENKSGSIKPTAITRAIALMGQARPGGNREAALPCA
jgi:hypothetical protein